MTTLKRIYGATIGWLHYCSTRKWPIIIVANSMYNISTIFLHCLLVPMLTI